MLIKESMPGGKHLAMVSHWSVSEVHIDFIANLCTYLQTANFTVGTRPLKIGVVTLGVAALRVVVSVPWGQKTLPKLVQKMFPSIEGSEPKLPSAMPET